MQHIDTAVLLLSNYRLQQPLHLYLKAYFRQNKKHGSKDRKQISSLCYHYFRLGFAFKKFSAGERILIGLFLCEHAHSELLHSLKSEWNDEINKPLTEKLAIGNWQSEINDIFPFKKELSNGIDAQKFNVSFLYQPRLFIRIRPGFNKIVKQKIQANNLSYEVFSENCISLPNSSKIDAVIELDKEAVVQDYNSQRTGEFMQLAIDRTLPVTNVWDCCAASGGKAIMAYDINPGIKLTITDKRKSILEILQRRFDKAGIKNYLPFVEDLSGAHIALSTFAGKNAGSRLNTKGYDLVIADVPCTGSGTWSRTPEQLYYFTGDQIKKYSDLQKQIVTNAIPYVKTDGHFLYITCSVFKEENEGIAAYIQDNFKMDVVKMEVLKGYEMLADTMFAVLFVNP